MDATIYPKSISGAKFTTRYDVHYDRVYCKNCGRTYKNHEKCGVIKNNSDKASERSYETSQ
jgi:hypothetical protein